MFRVEDRKYDDYLVLAAGWGFDWRIFGRLELPFNYIFYEGNSEVDFTGELENFLRLNGIGKVSLLGWSHGGFKVCDFACKNSEMVEKIILVSMRRRYESESLEPIKGYLKKNRKAYLYSFYKECFCENEKEDYKWFKKVLSKDYLSQMSLEYLLGSLEALGRANLDIESLKKMKKVTIVHGKEDKIAPIEEALQLAKELSCSRFMSFDQSGHLPFLHGKFKDDFINKKA